MLHFPNLCLALGSMNTFPCETPAGTASQVTSQCPNCSWLLVGLGWGSAEPMTPNTCPCVHTPLLPPLQGQQFGKSTSAASNPEPKGARGCPAPGRDCACGIQFWKGRTVPPGFAVLHSQSSSFPGFCCSPFTEQLFCWRGITPANKSRAVSRRQLTRPVINYCSDERHKPRRGAGTGDCHNLLLIPQTPTMPIPRPQAGLSPEGRHSEQQLWPGAACHIPSTSLWR